MFSFCLNGGAEVALAAVMMLATATIAQAAVAPAPGFLYSTPDIQTVDCAVGAHLDLSGPASWATTIAIIIAITGIVGPTIEASGSAVNSTSNRGLSRRKLTRELRL